MIAALQTVVPEVGADCALPAAVAPTADRDRSSPRCSTSSARLPHDIVLVLDDYHVVDADDIQDGMAFLLEHLPPQMHLVITTRADPALPLARLRGRGELVEIRAADLRFTPEEAAAYLNEVMELELTARDVVALEGRTEGLDRCPATGGALDPGPRRCRRLHRRDLPGTIATSSTTWPTRSCTVNPNMSASSCCRPRSWVG